MLDITPLDHKEVKRVNKYEVLYIVTPELEDEAINCPGSWSGISRTTNPFCVTWLPARKPKAFVTPAYHTAQERMARQG